MSVKSVLVSGRSSQVSSSPRPRKRVTFADDTPVSAYVSEYHRSTQWPRRTNLSVMGSVRPDNNKTTTTWHSSRLACKSHPFSLFFSSRRVQISGSVEDYPVPAITVDTATDVCRFSRMVDVSPNLAFCYYPTCPVDRRCLASSEWFVVELS